MNVPAIKILLPSIILDHSPPGFHFSNLSVFRTMRGAEKFAQSLL